VDAVDRHLRESPHKGRKPSRCVYCGHRSYLGPACGYCSEVFKLDPVYREARS